MCCFVKARMEKIRVNNQIVSMRKLVKQAKLHAINKLVKQRKMVQLKKGTEAQLAKNKRKEERLCEEIKIIKKIPVDEVSRNSLMRLKDWKSVLLSKTSTLKERSFALLASFGPLQTEVEKFIAKNPRLVNLLPDFYEEWDAKKSDPHHQDAKRIKALELKLKKKQWIARLKAQSAKKRVENEKIEDKSQIKLFRDRPNLPHQNKQNICKSGGHLSDEGENVSGSEDDGDVGMSEAESDSAEVKSVKHSNIDLEEDDSNEITLDGSKNISSPSKKKKEAVIMQLDNLQDQESLKISDLSNSDNESVESDGVLKENVKKDPFFLSADASDDDAAQDNVNNFSNIPSSHSKEGQHQSRIEKTNVKQNFSGFNQRKPFPRKQGPHAKCGLREQRFGHNKFDRNQKRDSHHTMNKFSRNSRDNEHNKPRFSKNNKSDWKSPTAGKSPIGCGAKFSSNFSKNTSFKNNQSFSKQASFKTASISPKKGAALHPSWEAKRKLKQQSSQLLPFQGKKTTFE